MIENIRGDYNNTSAYVYGLRESSEKWQTSVIACEVTVHTTGGVLERAISMERVTLPM